MKSKAPITPPYGTAAYERLQRGNEISDLLGGSAGIVFRRIALANPPIIPSIENGVAEIKGDGFTVRVSA